MAGKRPAKKLRLFHGLMRNEWEEWQSTQGDVAVTFTIPLFSAVNRGKPRGGGRNVQEGGGAEGGGAVPAVVGGGGMAGTRVTRRWRVKRLPVAPALKGNRVDWYMYGMRAG